MSVGIVILAGFVLFVLAMLGMAVGVLFRGRRLSGSCGGSTPDGESLADCVCARKDAEICAGDEENDLVRLAELGNPGRNDFHVHGPTVESENFSV